MEKRNRPPEVQVDLPANDTNPGLQLAAPNLSVRRMQQDDELVIMRLLAIEDEKDAVADKRLASCSPRERPVDQKPLAACIP